MYTKIILIITLFVLLGNLLLNLTDNYKVKNATLISTSILIVVQFILLICQFIEVIL